MHRRPKAPLRLPSTIQLAAVAAALAVAAVRISGQAAPPVQAVSPFDMVGFIQKATLDNSSDVFSGGSMTINGHVVIVPRNTLLQMPAFALTWQEVFALAPLPYGLAGNGQSGLALTDAPPPLVSYEVHVQGNRVVDGSGDRYIAGLVFLAQQSLNTGQGFVNYIDYAKGELRVGGTPGDGTTGARVRINDPQAKFSKGGSPDRRFTIDEDNPTVRTETGYPMCVPRSDPRAADDPYCPQGNRPKDVSGEFVTTYTYPVAPSVAGQLPDPRLAAPFEIGDYISYAGTLAADPPAAGAQGPTTAPYPLNANSPSTPQGPNDTYVSAHTIIANLGFFTWPGSTPVYVAIDVMLMGTGGLNTPFFPQEATLRTRVEGFTTDPTSVWGGQASIDIYAMDVDPCTGVTTDWLWVTGVAVDQGPPVGAVRGRWRFRPTGGIFLPPSRNLRAVMSDGRRLTTASLPNGTGLDTGQYNAPIFEFIFPENLGVGNPPVPMNLVDFPFLANGSGPYYGAVPRQTSSGIVGQLSPWPGASAPAATICGSTGTIQLPVASAVATPATATSGATVTLDASGSVDPNTPSSLTFVWTESGTPNGTTPVTFTQTATPGVVTLVAPAVTAQATLTFNVAVTNAAGTANASTSVTVTPPGLPSVSAAASPNPAPSGSTVTLSASPVTTGVTYRWTQVSGSPQMSLVGANQATASFQSPVLGIGAAPVSLGFQVTATNAAGRSTASTGVTLTPPADTVTITAATYRLVKSRLQVTATTNGPITIDSKTGGLISPTLTLSFFDWNSSKTITSTAWFMVGGVPTCTVVGYMDPSWVTVTSSYGGSATAFTVAR